jgi:predicted GNAT family acetyltransferase
VTDVSVSKNAEQSRYEARVDEKLAGFAEYELDEGRIVFTHTVVEDEYEGQGVGSALARQALDDVRADGALRVVPRCRFIKGWIEKHPDYQDLVQPLR